MRCRSSDATFNSGRVRIFEVVAIPGKQRLVHPAVSKGAAFAAILPNSRRARRRLRKVKPRTQLAERQTIQCERQLTMSLNPSCPFPRAAGCKDQEEVGL